MATPAAAPGEGRRKTVVVVGVDDGDHSYYALEWTARHVAAAAELVVVHAKPFPFSVVSFGGPAAGEVVRYVESDLRKMAEEVVERARRICIASSVHGLVEVIEGEPRYGREAPRGSAGRGQPWLRRDQKGFSRERERLLRAPCALLRDDSEATQAQKMI